MPINQKVIATLGLFSLIILVAFTSMAPTKEGFKNLKVLPKNIQHEQLVKVMHEWSNSLGVHCDFCHAPKVEGKGLDFASDAKPEKEIARKMYKMMNKINQKYFEAQKDSLGMMKATGVNCNTCHRGVSHPEPKVPEAMKKGPDGPGSPVIPGSTGTPDSVKKQ